MQHRTKRRSSLISGAVLALALVVTGTTPAVAAEVSTATVGKEATPQDVTSVVSKADTPKVLGGEKGGFTEETLTVPNQGTLKASINNDTGNVTATYPSGEVSHTSLTEIAQQLQAAIQSDAFNEQGTQYGLKMPHISVPHVSKEDVCPYVVSAVGAVHQLSWAEVLSLAAVHPAIAVLAALRETAFWTWVGTHCK